MHVLLHGMLEVFAAALGPVRANARALGRAATWRGPDLSRWTVAAAVAAFLPIVPLGFAVTRFAVAAWRLAGDPMLFIFGLIFALPAALMALTVLALALAGALWVAAALIGDREGARAYAAVYAVAFLAIAGLFALSGLYAYAGAIAVGAALLLVALAAGRR